MCQMHFPRASLQVRATGPVNKYTRQPVKGRKAGGGVRFGEMERDGLLSHGSSFLLRDRCRLCVLFYPCGSRAGGLGAFVSCRSLYLWLTLDRLVARCALQAHDLLRHHHGRCVQKVWFYHRDDASCGGRASSGGPRRAPSGTSQTHVCVVPGRFSCGLRQVCHCT